MDFMLSRVDSDSQVTQMPWFRGRPRASLAVAAALFVAVFVVRMLTGDPGFVNLKCDPDWAIELRAQYPAVEPGYHTNKRHWNSVTLDGTVDQTDLHDMIRHSYELVVASLPKSERARLLGP